MNFISLDFAVFLPVVFLLYWNLFNKNPRSQNALLLVSSYVFYSWWDWRFLFLIILSTLIDFFVGRALEKENRPLRRKLLLGTSILVNLGLLGIFKYFNFFLDSLYNVVPGLQVVLGFNTLEWILPVGISFYTFQTLSYTIDVYKGRISASEDIISFATFVSFFPQLVAGPIERASHLLPQFKKTRNFDHSIAVEGLRQILWGLFKKMVIADNCAHFANLIFNNSENFSGSTVLLGAVFFSFQIYGDFSGYSDIAIGASKLFGIKLMSNFTYPYFSRNISEFWRRWHISLTTWFRDYVYIPLGGNRGSTGKTVRNIFVVFFVSGLWHGANWTFVFWGLMHAGFFLLFVLLGKKRTKSNVTAYNSIFPGPKDFLLMCFNFFVVTIFWIFFRAKSLRHAYSFIGEIFSYSFLTVPEFPGKKEALITVVLVIFLVIIEWWGRREEFPLKKLKMTRWQRYSVYYILILLIIFFSAPGEEFIYFQF